MADGWIELFDVETDEAGVLFVFNRFEPVDYGCGVFPLVEIAFFRDCADTHSKFRLVEHSGIIRNGLYLSTYLPIYPLFFFFEGGGYINEHHHDAGWKRFTLDKT